MLEAVINFARSPISTTFIVNGVFVLIFLFWKKKAIRTKRGNLCCCADKRVGGGDLFGGAAGMSFGTPWLFFFLLTGFEFVRCVFLIQFFYSLWMLMFVVVPKWVKHGKVRIESHAFGNLSLCGMVAVLNIGPIFWLSLFPPLKHFVGVIVDRFTWIHHYCATVILWAVSFGRITTGWSKYKYHS